MKTTEITKKEKKKEPVAKKEKAPTFADQLDVILKAGGTWPEMVEKGKTAATKHKVTTKVTRGCLRGHAAYRLKRNTDYLNGMILTDTGVEKPTKAKSK